MAQVIYQIVDSYYKTFEKFPKLPLIWSRQTHRLLAVRNFKDLTGWGSECIFLLGLCVLIPKFAQFIYIVQKYLQLGHYPDQDEFASPIQLLSIAVAILGSGVAISISFFGLLFNREIVQTLNSLFDVEQLLVTRGNILHNRAENHRDKLTPKEALIAKVVGHVPLFAFYFAPAIAIFAVANGLDPLTFVVDGYFRPDWRRYQLVWFLGFKAFSLIMLTSAVISASKMLLGVACLFTCPAWFLQHTIRMLGKDYEVFGNQGVVWIRNVRIYIIMYNTIVIGFTRFGPYLAVIILFVLVACGFAITVCNVVIVRMRTYLPISFGCVMPTKEPIQLLSVAVSSIGGGGAIVASSFGLLFKREIVQTVNSIYDMEQVLVTRGNILHNRAENYRDKLTPKEALFAQILGYVPLFALYVAPALGIFAVAKGLDPLTFVMDGYFRPDWERYQLAWFLGFKAFSLIMVTAAVISASFGCVMLTKEWERWRGKYIGNG
ncbi:hypothetical protein Fcan01_10601 [Folsomia candida]|uniref:Uncharacterized protein n=1 Tax=Folsomia candida TaxID=158441 RepID=A0A226EBH7_FOLCA|nr:hypothetical protein Fcan01_10601 [Folsomia candida]